MTEPLPTKSLVISLTKYILLHQQLLQELNLEPIDPSFIQQIKDLNRRSTQSIQNAQLFLHTPDSMLSQKDLSENYEILQQKYRAIQLRLEAKTNALEARNRAKTESADSQNSKLAEQRSQLKLALGAVAEYKEITNLLQTENARLKHDFEALKEKSLSTIKADQRNQPVAILRPPPFTQSFDEDVFVLKNTHLESVGEQFVTAQKQQKESAKVSDNQSNSQQNYQQQDPNPSINDFNSEDNLPTQLCQLKNIYEEQLNSKNIQIADLKNQINRFKSLLDDRACKAECGEFPQINLKIPKKFIEIQTQNDKMRQRINEFNLIFEELIEARYFGQTIEQVKQQVEIERNELAQLQKQKQSLQNILTGIESKIIDLPNKSFSLVKKNASFIPVVLD
ncbi:hypothetical protein SS50377_20316 [Spironucleus salmonicida]|uniref:Uncharacterized protein n=1 Tax=Spironucleus salmonicida TaxID=348837 RepID=V6LFC7_9EUKA|nr:hypothetical protein SS50377_20316 [Spironucleus salmonicida]|eukprot:EST42998.1 Hypothetical protein SS50377_17299 [Spironucleus salmonicida]